LALEIPDLNPIENIWAILRGKNQEEISTNSTGTYSSSYGGME